MWTVFTFVLLCAVSFRAVTGQDHKPPNSGVSSVVWAVPVLVIIGILVAVVVLFGLMLYRSHYYGVYCFCFKPKVRRSRVREDDRDTESGNDQSGNMPPAYETSTAVIAPPEYQDALQDVLLSTGTAAPAYQDALQDDIVNSERDYQDTLQDNLQDSTILSSTGMAPAYQDVLQDTLGSGEVPGYQSAQEGVIISNVACGAPPDYEDTLHDAIQTGTSTAPHVTPEADSSSSLSTEYADTQQLHQDIATGLATDRTHQVEYAPVTDSHCGSAPVTDTDCGSVPVTHAGCDCEASTDSAGFERDVESPFMDITSETLLLHGQH